VHTNRGDFVISFVDPRSRRTVNNFVYLSQNHFYDGLTFHRVSPASSCRGGDPLKDRTAVQPTSCPTRTTLKSGRRHGRMASSQAGVSGRSSSSRSATPVPETSGVANHFGQSHPEWTTIDKIQQGDP
jgi:cyclophilin family peptidyl-prolyl cis-trans isomerase